MNIRAEQLKRGNATIVDVRTAAEFTGGHVQGSMNIPLQEVPQRVEELRRMENLILCCASGNRSGQAARFLQSRGIECINGGSWTEVDTVRNQR